MSVLEQVSQMKSQGIPEQEIVSRLNQQKISPKEINDALDQSKIKDAIYKPQETNIPTTGTIPTQENVQSPYVPRTQEYATPQPQAEYAPPQEYATPQPQAEYAPPQEMYQQEAYGYPASEGEQSSDIIIEISEQIFNEKIKKIEKQIDKIKDVQTLLQTQTKHSTESLKRIESIMDKLQIAILEKVGSYGKNLESIKKEMGMIEDSFAKIVPHAKKLAHKKVNTKRKISKKK
jgi:hypothetical protein